MSTVELGRRRVGRGHPCFLAAEVGLNHNGDMRLAHEIIEAASAAGADAVKFQNYRVDDFLSDSSLTYEYLSEGRVVVESQYDMFKRCELEPSALANLREHCDASGVEFFSTPTSAEGILDLKRAGARFLKNGSDFLVHLPLIRCMGQSGLPSILSVGMATLAEVDDAVMAFRSTGGQDLILLHCTSSYPTPPEDVHLAKIPVLAAAFGCPVGLSDHTDGIVAAIGAVALGACMIEKHFTLDKELTGPDHRFSADPEEFRQMVSAVRTLEASLGSAVIGPVPSECSNRDSFRLSCVAAQRMPAGHLLTEEDIAFRRPGTGFPPRVADCLVGRRLGRAVEPGKLLEPADFVQEIDT